MLTIKNLHASVEDKAILKGVDLEVAAGEVHAIMGPNGSGKSTLAHVLSGRDGYEVTSGTVTYQGKDLLELSADERACQGLLVGHEQVRLPLAHRAVDAGKQRFCHFDDRDFAAERRVYGRELKADVSTTDHKQARGHILELECAGRVHEARTLDAQRRRDDRSRCRTGLSHDAARGLRQSDPTVGATSGEAVEARAGAVDGGVLESVHQMKR